MNPKHLHRTTDPETSVEAAQKAAKKAHRLHKLIVSTWVMNEADCPECTWKAFKFCEQLWEVEYPTIRKRFGELATLGYIEETGETRNRCRIFRLTPKGREFAKSLNEKPQKAVESQASKNLLEGINTRTTEARDIRIKWLLENYPNGLPDVKHHHKEAKAIIKEAIRVGLYSSKTARIDLWGSLKWNYRKGQSLEGGKG